MVLEVILGCVWAVFTAQAIAKLQEWYPYPAGHPVTNDETPCTFVARTHHSLNQMLFWKLSTVFLVKSERGLCKLLLYTSFGSGLSITFCASSDHPTIPSFNIPFLNRQISSVWFQCRLLGILPVQTWIRDIVLELSPTRSSLYVYAQPISMVSKVFPTLNEAGTRRRQWCDRFGSLNSDLTT